MSKRTPSGFLQVGASQVEITAPLAIPYLAHLHEGRHRAFEGIHDPLFAKALVLDDGERRIALLVADSIGFAKRIMGEDKDFIHEVRRRVEHRTGIPPDHVMVSATHAHSTPETIGFRRLLDHPGAAEWLSILADHLAQAAATADAARKPMRLRIIKGSVDGAAESRRLVGKDGRTRMRWGNPPADEIADWGLDDPELTLLCFQTPDGASDIVLVHFACHPVAVQAQPLISADFPGVVTARIQGAGIGCRHCLFFQGAAGDINPVRYANGFGDVEYEGQLLSNAAIGLVESAMASGDPVAFQNLGAVRDIVRLPSRELPSLDSLERESRHWQNVMKTAATDLERDVARSTLLGLEERLECVRRSKASYEAEIQAFRIGDAALVGIPGEPFVEFGLQLKRGSAAPTTLCLGYTNDYLGYIAPPSAWAQGGYEVSLGMWSVVGPESFGILLTSARQLVGRLF